jgi:hypothetical protein
MSRPYRSVDRRTALKLLASGVATTTAGCLGGDDTTSTSKQTSTPTATPSPTATATDTPTETETAAGPPETPAYLEWAFATTLLESEPPIHVFHVSPSTVEQYDDRLNERAYSTYNQLTELGLVATGVSGYNVHDVITTRDVSVLLGEFSQRRVHENHYRKYEFEPPEYRKFMLYEHAEENTALAANDGVAIAIDRADEPSVDVRKTVKRVIDTGMGDYKRLVDQRPRIEPLASWLGTRTISDCVTHDPYTDRAPTGKTGSALGYNFTEGGAEARFVIQFETAEQATDEAVDTWVDRQVPYIDNWTDTTRTHHGAIVMVTGQVTYDAVLNATA